MNATDLNRDTSPFHPGERAVQERIGVRDRAEAIGRRVIRDHLPEQHRAFYAQLPFVVLGAVDDQGWPWATLLAGNPGFTQSPDPRSLSLDTFLPPDDPAMAALRKGAPVGGLGIELPTRRRNRFSATVEDRGPTRLSLTIDQAFGNCPQYIQTRDLTSTRDPSQPHAERPGRITAFDAATAALIAAADTFFVASTAGDTVDDSRTGGVDVSHRGGRPGFVRVDDGKTLTVPDFAGNKHFNTLGNFLNEPRAGLVFVDFETGALVQLTGTVEIIWDDPEVDAFSGAERLWRFTLDHGLVRPEALPFRFAFGAFSPKSLQIGAWPEVRGDS